MADLSQCGGVSSTAQGQGETSDSDSMVMAATCCSLDAVLIVAFVILHNLHHSFDLCARAVHMYTFAAMHQRWCYMGLVQTVKA